MGTALGATLPFWGEKLSSPLCQASSDTDSVVTQQHLLGTVVCFWFQPPSTHLLFPKKISYIADGFSDVFFPEVSPVHTDIIDVSVLYPA